MRVLLSSLFLSSLNFEITKLYFTWKGLWMNVKWEDLKCLIRKMITHFVWSSVTYMSMLFQAGCLQGVPVVYWARAWSAHYVLVFLSTSSTSKFISVMFTVWIKGLSHVCSVVSRWRTAAVCVYMSTNNTAKNRLPQNSLSMRLHMVLESEINWKCPCNHGSKRHFFFIWVMCWALFLY